MLALRRDFMPGDLRPEIEQAGVDGVVAVQARQTTGETEWLLELADEFDFVRGVVGWVPLTSPDVERDLERFANNQSLVGVRHILHDESDDDYVLRPDFNRGIGLLGQFKLVYDILIFERHLPQTISFVDQHPNQVFVVDHVAKPRIRDGVIEPWHTNIKRLAERDNVFCKVSGMVTEAKESWTLADLNPYWETVLEAFGPSRLIFGSDWPVCKLVTEYPRWYDTVAQMTAMLSADEQAAILGGNAIDVYGINV